MDGKYWFPVYTKVDDALHFSTGDIHVRQVVKYTDYKRFGSNSKIIYEGQEIGKGTDKGSGTAAVGQPAAGGKHAAPSKSRRRSRRPRFAVR